MTIRQFDCAACGAHCLTTTPEADANKEFLESGLPVDDSAEIVSVCDDCYAAAMERARQLGIIPTEGDR